MTNAADLVMAVDVGSTSARAGIFDADGRLLARASHGFAVHRPAPDHAEHSSEEIWQAVCRAARAALAEAAVDAARIAGLAFDATCSLAVFDGDGQPVTVSVTGEDRWNVVMWADHRAVAEAAAMTATGHRVIAHVGGVMSPEMEMPKLRWLKSHLPASWARMGLALDLADFLLWRATGRVAVSTCTVTCKWGYLAHETPGWQADFLEGIGLADLPARAALPDRAWPIGADAGPLAPQAARELGLPAACVAGVGLIDAHAGGLGVLGGIAPQETNRRLAVISGTSTCHMAVSASPRQVPGVWGPFCNAMIPGRWLNEGGQSATGALLQHILDLHAEGGAGHGRVTGRIAELLAEDGPGMVGPLTVLPDFHGNRSPVADPEARGIILGLSLDASFDGLARLYYAAALGIALGTRHIIDRLDGHGYAIDTLHLTGGHVANPVLVRLYADATGCEVVLPEQEDGVLLGTAAAAAAAAGLHPSLKAAGRAMVRGGRVVRPDPAHRAFFDRRYALLLDLQQQEARLRRTYQAV